MTDRFFSLTVALERDIREDDAEHLINAIKMLKGVIDVEGNIANLDLFTAESRVKRELTQKIWDVLK